MFRISKAIKSSFPFLILATAMIAKLSQCNSVVRETSSVATIEVLAIVDHTLAEILGSDQVINDYISANWNAVNRYFRQFKDPEVHVKLVGLKILRSEAEEGFFVYKRDNHGGSYLHWATLHNMQPWLFKHKDELPKNDLAYLHFGIRNHEGRGNNRADDYCSPAPYHKPVCYGDTWGAGSNTPRITAHEVGHTLGARHCDASGYVMCNGPKISGFYETNVKIISETIKSALGKCVTTSEATKEQLSQFNFNRTIMPGDVIPLDLQCERLSLVKGTKPNFDKSDCDKLVCLMPNGEEYNSQPAVGTRELCPEGQRCFEGVCKAE